MTAKVSALGQSNGMLPLGWWLPAMNQKPTATEAALKAAVAACLANQKGAHE